MSSLGYTMGRNFEFSKIPVPSCLGWDSTNVSTDALEKG